MNKESWLKFIRHSTEAHHIREIFNGTYSLLTFPHVQKMFLDRIDTLMKTSRCPHTRKALTDLKEDIELEIEHKGMKKKDVEMLKAEKPQFVTSENTSKIEKIESAIERIGRELERIEDVLRELRA